MTSKLRPDLMRMKDENIVLGAKIFAILFPILIVSTMHAQFVIRDPVIKLIWANLICRSAIVLFRNMFPSCLERSWKAD